MVVIQNLNSKIPFTKIIKKDIEKKLVEYRNKKEYSFFEKYVIKNLSHLGDTQTVKIYLKYESKVYTMKITSIYNHKEYNKEYKSKNKKEILGFIFQK